MVTWIKSVGLVFLLGLCVIAEYAFSALVIGPTYVFPTRTEVYLQVIMWLLGMIYFRLPHATNQKKTLT